MRRERIHAEHSNEADCRDYLSNLGEQASAQVTYVLSTRLETVGNKDTMHVIRQSMNSGAGTGAGRRERKYPRVKVTLPAEARHIMEGFPRRGQTANISEGGCYIEMLIPLPIGTDLRLTLWIHESKIFIQGVVVSFHPGYGCGIKFTEITRSDRDILSQFLEELKASSQPEDRRFAPKGASAGSRE